MTRDEEQAAADRHIQPWPASEKCEAANFTVTFINPDTAIMTHSTKGADAHSRHVTTSSVVVP
jgi:hypothetical protein